MLQKGVVMSRPVLIAIFLAVIQHLSAHPIYGNIPYTVTSTSREFIYNQNQQLIRVVDNGATTAEYTYNGFGQRVKKIAGGVTTIFHYDQWDHLIAESDSTGHFIAEYVYLNGQPLAKIEGANTYYYHNDHLGTPQKMTDAAGTVVWAADYKPFGEATITISTLTNNLRGIGQYFDQETGLIYNHFRYLNPQTGKYIQADPIGLEGGINPYVYVANNPNRNIDPNGLLCKNKNSANPPMGGWTGTDMPTGAALAALDCVEKCIGKGYPFSQFPVDNGTDCTPYDLQISGGSECTPSGTHLPGSTPGSKHCTNQAFDLPPDSNDTKTKCCAKKCGVKSIVNEGNHLHFQLTGNGGSLPSDKDCCSVK